MKALDKALAMPVEEMDDKMVRLYDELLKTLDEYVWKLKQCSLTNIGVDRIRGNIAKRRTRLDRLLSIRRGNPAPIMSKEELLVTYSERIDTDVEQRRVLTKLELEKEISSVYAYALRHRGEDYVHRFAIRDFVIVSEPFVETINSIVGNLKLFWRARTLITVEKEEMSQEDYDYHFRIIEERYDDWDEDRIA